MEITTILPPEGVHEDHGVEVPVMLVAGVSERPGDEGENELDERGPGEGDPQTGDPNVDPDDTPNLEDWPGDADEDNLLWMRLGLQPVRGQIDVFRSNWRRIEGQIDVFRSNWRSIEGQIDVVRSNWRRIEGQIDVAWLNLHQVIVDASQEHGTVSREEHYLRAEVELLTHMSLLMPRRAEILQSFDTEC